MKARFIGFFSLFVLLPALVFAQDAGSKKKAYFFFLDTCPHCHNVDNYFQANGIYDKYDITKLDASNPFNGNLLGKFYAATGNPNAGGVPAVAFGDKFMVGDQPIIDNFVREIDAAENANDLPDPAKISPAASDNPAPQLSGDQPQGDQAAGDNPSSLANGGAAKNNQMAVPTTNKKNYLPIMLIALIVIGGGILIFINRKKSN